MNLLLFFIEKGRRPIYLLDNIIYKMIIEKKEEKSQVRKNDFILIGILLLISLMGFFLYSTIIKQDGEEIRITLKGELYKRVSLSKEQVIEIMTPEGGKNIIEIKDKSVIMKEANCKDLICVHHKPISYHGETIVCLPNKVVVEVISQKKSTVDTIAN